MIDSIHQFILKKKVGFIRIDGSTPPASRQALVTDCQEKDGIKAAVLSIRAGGVGLTLTAASKVIFAELSWTPGDIIQAEDRVHRIGQMLDGHENALEVSHSQPRSSLAKQRTLDSFIKRCNNANDFEHQSKLKQLKHCPACS